MESGTRTYTRNLCAHSAGSVFEGLRIARSDPEGFDGRSTPEFVRFLGYAFRSATEVQSHLYVALDHEYLMKNEFNNLYQRAVEAKKLINGFIRYLRKAAR